MSVEVHVTFLFQNSTRSILITIIRVSIKRFRAVLRHHLPVLDLLCRAAVFLIQTNVSLSLPERPPDVALSSGSQSAL